MPELSADALRCAPLISAQFLAAKKAATSSRPSWQVPEPWNGRLKSAPLLFLGQNPGANHLEEYPDPTWLSDTTRVLKFFDNRFGTGRDDAPILEGTKVRLRDQHGYANSTPFLSEVLTIASRIYARKARPGVDYGITEAVRCKATNAVGIERAMETCAPRHLKTTLELSGAKVVVCLGGAAKRAFTLATDASESLAGKPFSWEARLVVFIEHPGAWKKSEARHLSEATCRELRAYLDSTRVE